MTYDMLLKLVMDFYSDDAVSQAKSILLDNVVIPEDDDKKRNRKGLNKKLNTMKDILNLFHVMTLEDLPLFVASDLSNLPALSMDNSDMSSVVREMEIIKNQMRIMQEVQETSLKVHLLYVMTSPVSTMRIMMNSFPLDNLLHHQPGQHL